VMDDLIEAHHLSARACTVTLYRSFTCGHTVKVVSTIEKHLQMDKLSKAARGLYTGIWTIGAIRRQPCAGRLTSPAAFRFLPEGLGCC
jgi:hypothetical protein